MRLWQELRSARTWNSTLGERQLGYPCDPIVPLVDESYYRAVDVDAPAKVVFRWLCQLQYGAYSYGPVNRLGGVGPDQLTSGAELPVPGQRFMRHFRLVELEPGRHLTLQLAEKNRWLEDLVVTYVVDPRPAASCRLVAKVMVQLPESGLGRLLSWTQPYLNFVAMRKQLLTLKLLAERDRALTG